MAWVDFVNDTGAGTAIIDADDINANFDWLEGTREPMMGGTKTANTYDLGSSDYPWREIYQSGNRLIDTSVQLTGSTADGFAATPTAIYNMDATSADAPDAAYSGTKVGAYDLTVKAESLASGADALGNAKYCQFAGSGYLLSTNAVFDFSGAFSLGLKVLLPDWSPASAQTIISNADGADAGCRLDVSTAGLLIWRENNTNILSANVNGLDVAKFHDIKIWRTASTVYLFIDGVCVASAAKGTITTKAKFQISGYNGATQLLPSGARIDEVFVDLVNTPTADTLRNIYARSAKKFAVKDANGAVKIEGNTNVSQEILLATGTTTATSKDTYLIGFVPEDGLYELTAQAFGYTSGTALQMLGIIAVGSATYGSATAISTKYVYEASANTYKEIHQNRRYRLKAGDAFHYYLRMVASGGNVVLRGENDYPGSTLISAVKLAD